MRPARQTRYALAHDLDSWRSDDRIAARGFVHRWESVVAEAGAVYAANQPDGALTLRHIRRVWAVHL